MRHLLFLSTLLSVSASAQSLKTESFDHDPHWDSQNNRIIPDHYNTVTQDFGYSANEIGGVITRTNKPAFYGKQISATLNDHLSASGTFWLTQTRGNTGIFFGFFNANQPGGSGRPIQSLGMDFDGEPSGARLAVRMISGTNNACGTFITPFIPGKFRPTPIRNDGTRYTWSLNYNPSIGHGQFTFTIKSDRDIHENFENKAFTVDVPEAVRNSGATFDHLGLMNTMKSGSSMTVHFGDLSINGEKQDFSQDPHWDSSGNRTKYEDREPAGAHNFGYSETQFAGGAAVGEMGGLLWRGGKFAYYADRVGPLSLQNKLEAHGRVVLEVGAPDSDVFIGYFHANENEAPTTIGNFLGVHIGGPTRIGHEFSPMIVTSKAVKARKDGPVLKQQKTYEWSFSYDPDAANGNGELRVTLGDQTAILTPRNGIKSQGATFDHFGIFNPALGGQLVKIYFDDLTYIH